MADNPVDPTPPSGNQPAPHSPDNPAAPQKGGDSVSYQKGHLVAKAFKWGSMYFTAPEAQKLWNALIQQLNTQIKSDQERALKALKKLKKSSTGDGGDDDD